MAISINLGSGAGSTNGDTLYEAFTKVNAISNQSVQYSNKSDLIVGKNKFNKATAVIGSYLNENNQASSNVIYDYSDFIEVDELQQYIANFAIRFTTYFDINENFVSGGSSTSISSGTVISFPSGVKYIKITISHSDLNNFQLEKGSLSTTYNSYRLDLNPIYLTGYTETIDIENKADLVASKNKFNKATAVIGEFLNENNQSSSNAVYDYSDFIKVDELQQYIANYAIRFTTYFDVNKNFVSGGSSTIISLGTVISFPVGVKYIKITISHSDLNNFQLEKGSLLTTYNSYRLDVNPIYLTGYAETIDIENKADLVAGKNKFDKSTVTIGSYLTENNIALSNAVYDYSDFIEVDELQQYIANYAIRFTTYFDVNKNFVSGGSSTSISSGTVISFPIGVKYIKITISHSDLNNFQLEKGSLLTTYAPYKMIVSDVNLEIYRSQIINDTADDSIFKLFLPKEICVAVGKTIELYNNQVSWCGNINDYHFLWSGVGKSMKRKWSLTGTTIENNTLTLKVYNKNNFLIASKTTTVKVVSSTISTPFTIAAIGDSLSNQKPWNAEITSLSSGNITFVGTRNSGTSEGRSGASSGYYLGNNSYTYDSLGIDGIDGRTQNLNPFWSPVTSDVNFQYYKDNYSTPNPSKLIIWLGTNGITVDPTTNATNIKTFIDKIRLTGGSTIPIFVVHTLFRANQDGIGKQEGTDGYVVNSSYKLEEDLKVFNLQEKMLADLTGYSNLYLVPVSTCHDSEYNFGAVSTPVNPRASQVEFLPVEATHPQTQGYLQIADIIFSSLAANQ